jgi:hypothetical protein
MQKPQHMTTADLLRLPKRREMFHASTPSLQQSCVQHHVSSTQELPRAPFTAAVQIIIRIHCRCTDHNPMPLYRS